jgi:hypothetical protein
VGIVLKFEKQGDEGSPDTWAPAKCECCGELIDPWAPVIKCDVCGKVITDGRAGVYLFDTRTAARIDRIWNRERARNPHHNRTATVREPSEARNSL